MGEAHLQGMSGDELAALPHRFAGVGVELQMRSVADALAGQQRLIAAQTVTIATASGLFRRGSRAVLAGVGIDPLSLRDLDTRETGWRERLDPQGLLVADVGTAQAIGELPGMRVFRVISDASLEELCLAVG